jgi:NADPH-dependent 2,4-dienoyl-CoA reductase/sulfur reductase-like enzyme
VARGDADLVAMARAIMADPQLVAKSASGQRHLVRPCIGLNECIHRQTVEGLPYGCAVNPRAGRESEKDLEPTARLRRILVVGGGPAGMEVAALAAEVGHDVTLWERADHLGGQFAIAARARMNATFSDWITWQGERLGRAGVEVELARVAVPEDVLAAGADTVIVATGARPRPLAAPGADDERVVQGTEVLTGAASVGSRVLVVAEDDRPAPAAVADHLAGAGHEVTLAFRTPALAPLVGKYSMGALLARLDAGGVQLVPLTRVVGVALPEVELAHAYSGRRWSVGPFDTVVLSCGAVPVDGLYHELKDRHPDVHLLGDAYAPRRVVFATRQAWDLVRTLG